MAKVRKISPGTSTAPIFLLVDANVLANYALPFGDKVAKRRKADPDGETRCRIRRCREWWDWIEKELSKGAAVVYVLDICIAEAFKVLAKKYYREQWWNSPDGYRKAKQRLSRFVTITHKEMRRQHRLVKVHDLPTVRDMIIGVERFYELIHKNKQKNKKKNVQIADLLLMAAAKYLLDFYRIPKDRLYILTGDQALLNAIRAVTELPNGIDPCKQSVKKHLASEC